MRFQKELNISTIYELFNSHRVYILYQERMLPYNVYNNIVNAFTIPDSEVEFRIGNVISTKQGIRVDTNLSWIEYDRTLRFFQSKGAEKQQSRYTTDIAGDIHHRYGDNIDNWYQKVREYNFYNQDYGYKLSISREIPIQPIPNFHPTLTRVSSRTSFLLFGGKMRADFTEVTNPSNGTNKYEIELELLQSTDLDTITKALKYTLIAKQDTIEVYSYDEKSRMISWINRVLGGSQRDDIIDHSPLVQARNLRIDDLTYGGLVGNSKTAYTITHKVDGVRKLLVFNRQGIWLVMAPSELMCITKKEQKDLYGTILDGELVPPESRNHGAPSSRLWFIPYDALSMTSVNGYSIDYSTGIQQMPHVERLNYAQAIADKFKGDILYISTKSFKTINTVEDFFTQYRELSHEQLTDGNVSVLPYKTDGMIVTPTNTPYNNHTDSIPLKDRVLTTYPDICKIKPIEQLTMDLAVVGSQVMMANMGQLIPFTGTSRAPANMGQLPDVPDGTVVEFGYRDGVVVPVRIRYDKTKPNQLPFVLDTWKLIHSPLTYEMLSGNSFDLVRRYHNRIKRQLLATGSGLLLDIGSGRGGDVSKWSNYQHVYAVEPYHVEELTRRTASMNNITIIQAKGQDTDTIAQIVPKVDVVSLMLSLPFFFSSDEVLDGLVRTIKTLLKPDGKILFLTMDSNLVAKSFQGIKQLELGPASLIYQPPELYIKIPGTILDTAIYQTEQYPGYQREYLVDMDKLASKLSPEFELASIKIADEEGFLTHKEVLFTSMYSYGQFCKPEMAYLSQYSSNSQQLPVSTLSSSSELQQPYNIKPCVDPKPINPQIGTSQLPSIPTRAGTDDTYLPVNFQQPFNGQLVRIATIGDGSCFFHAVLKAYYKPYADNPSYSYRRQLVINLRRDLATILPMINPDTGTTYYEDANNGVWAQLAEHGRIDDLGNNVDYSLRGMQRLFDSDRDVGDEVFGFVSDMLGLDIYVVQLNSDDIRPHISIVKDRPAVVIGGNGHHYETIGVLHGDVIQTVFWPSDPLIAVLKCMFKIV